VRPLLRKNSFPGEPIYAPGVGDFFPYISSWPAEGALLGTLALAGGFALVLFGTAWVSALAGILVLARVFFSFINSAHNLRRRRIAGIASAYTAGYDDGFDVAYPNAPVDASFSSADYDALTFPRRVQTPLGSA
jgi:hypothetical protein